MRVIHKKTGNKYHLLGELINATNAQDGQIMVLYRNDKHQKFVREKTEFWEKFEREPNRCCVCGTTENLHYDGIWYGYRCNSTHCMVF